MSTIPPHQPCAQARGRKGRGQVGADPVRPGYSGSGRQAQPDQGRKRRRGRGLCGRHDAHRRLGAPPLPQPVQARRTASTTRCCAGSPRSWRETCAAGRSPFETDLGAAKCLILWGMNPGASTLGGMNGYTDLQKAGLKIIVVDPRYSETASKADLLAAPAPRHRRGAGALGHAAHHHLRGPV